MRSVRAALNRSRVFHHASPFSSPAREVPLLQVLDLIKLLALDTALWTSLLASLLLRRLGLLEASLL